ncbi:hypothetical protein D5S17_12565 [Pseudonocardiaceae bacterium YIM PH 21723]|nr:hypothetical protein D5S17_12565 [Pseudonocardiaceae bacterium YIM PH 21723]
MAAMISRGVVASLLAVSLLLAGCGDDAPPPAQSSSAPPSTSTPTASSSASVPPLQGSPVFDRIRQRGRLLIGVRSDAPELAAFQEYTGKWAGFDPAIARLIATELGFPDEKQVSFKKMPPNLQISGVASDSVDLQLGVLDREAATQAKVATAGPYVIVGGAPQYIGVIARDKVFTERLGKIIADALASGRWDQLAADELAAKRVPFSKP